MFGFAVTFNSGACTMLILLWEYCFHSFNGITGSVRSRVWYVFRFNWYENLDLHTCEWVQSTLIVANVVFVGAKDERLRFQLPSLHFASHTHLTLHWASHCQCLVIRLEFTPRFSLLNWFVFLSFDRPIHIY